MIPILNEIASGQPAPLGATPLNGGVNFAIASKTASAVELLLFNQKDDARPARIIALDPETHCTHPYWHIFVPGLAAGQIYAYRFHGTSDPSQGLRFDSAKVLLDPYGRGVVVPDGYSRQAAREPGDNTAVAMKNVVVDPHRYDWGNDRPLHLASSRTIVYEMHVRGFTRHPSSGIPEARRGTYAGLIDKIPYLQQLGITAVELLPVFAFDPQDAPNGRVNYWGYAPVSFFSPHPAFSSRQDPLGPLDEFRDMVKALHRAGIEVILDVVFNHTAEADASGPTLCFRGIDNPTYYILEKDPSLYANYTGCGNTFNANQPIVRRLVLDSLRYWVQEMHVDGFRFDLASILSRGSSGEPLANPPVLWDIDSEPALAGTKIIAEAWDAAGLYQVGNFIGDSWKEWNGRFRDDFRSFWRGDERLIGRVAQRLMGSPDIYAHKNREAEQSINFVTCHDGFTLMDVVSYNSKHNDANGEGNRDGSDDNRSWNCGVEGRTEDPAILDLRNRQMKNLLTVTMLSLGIPMILMGDETGRSQQGNNNTYCQDNELNWFDWSLVEKNAELLRFVRLLNARRLLRDVRPEKHRFTLNQLMRRAKISWHGVRIDQPDWSDGSRSLAVSAELPGDGLRIHWILNAFWESLDFELPSAPSTWRRWVDTGLASPQDIVEWQTAAAVPGLKYQAAPRSTVVLFSEAG